MTATTQSKSAAEVEELTLTSPEPETKSNGKAPKGKSKAPKKVKGTVHVALDDRGYDIVVKRGYPRPGCRITCESQPLGRAGPYSGCLNQPKVDHYYGQDIYSSLKRAGFDPLPIVLVAGECYKTLQTTRRIYRTLYEKGVDRRTLIIAVGGGVIGDVAGFVAATWPRGLT